MPFRTNKQRRYLWAKLPALARRWTGRYGPQPKPTGRSTTPKPKASKAKK